MKIAITGPQGTGKSTLTDALSKESIFDEYVIIKEITRDIKKLGLEINEGAGEITQIAINSTHLLNLRHKDLITDRCLIDGLIYTWYLRDKGKVDNNVFNFVYDCTYKYVSKYDLIVYIRPEFDLVDDGVRSVSEEFRDSIFNMFETLIPIFSHHTKVVEVTGTVKDRVEQIKYFINE